MKKIEKMISLLITAACFTSVIPAQAAEVITANEVRDLIFATGITDDETLELEIKREYDELSRRKIRDIIGDGASYCVEELPMNVMDQYIEQFGKYKPGDFAEYLDYTHTGNGYVPGGYAYRVVSEGTPENFAYIDLRVYSQDQTSNSYMYRLDEDNGGEYRDEMLVHDYGKIAELINEANIEKPSDIRIFDERAQLNVYINSPSGEFVITEKEMRNINAGYLGKSAAVMEPYKLIDAEEFLEFVCESYEDGTEAAKTFDAKARERKVDGILLDPAQRFSQGEQTDTRSAFVGSESQFKDVADRNSLLNASVNELVSMDIISGYEDGTFRPDGEVTRAEAAAMICRMMKYDGAASDAFSDVARESWYAPWVGAISRRGIVSGYEDGTFRPHENITYQQALKILYAILGQPGFDYDAIPIMADGDLMKNLDSFTFDMPVTRGNMAILLSNALDGYIMVTSWEFGGSMPVYIQGPECTLISYINGTELKGAYFTSLESEKQFFDETEKLFYESYGDLIFEYLTGCMTASEEKILETKQYLAEHGWSGETIKAYP
ncbi:MAG: S-layer homology domain-containing protein [bacterium]|nr:S-layer homology domain-containing protein [bacterium]